MKRILALFVLSILCTTGQTRSQTFLDYLSRFELGFGGESLTMLWQMDSVNTSNAYFGYSGVSIGWNLPVIQFDRNMAVAFYPSVRAEGFNSSSGQYPYSRGRPEMLVLVPLMATFRYGTDATFRSRKRFGLGVGLGYEYFYQDGIDLRYWHPTVMVEGSFRLKLAVIKLQFVRDFGYEQAAADIRMKHWGFYVVISDWFNKKW